MAFCVPLQTIYFIPSEKAPEKPRFKYCLKWFPLNQQILNRQKIIFTQRRYLAAYSAKAKLFRSLHCRGKGGRTQTSGLSRTFHEADYEIELLRKIF